jgi:hypothetical protein
MASPMREILNAAVVETEDDRQMLGLATSRMINCTGARPSHAARSTVDEYTANPAAFRKVFEAERAEDRVRSGR